MLSTSYIEIQKWRSPINPGYSQDIPNYAHGFIIVYRDNDSYFHILRGFFIGSEETLANIG